MKSVSFFAQRSWLLFSLVEAIKDSLKPLVDTVSCSTQTSCLHQILLKPLISYHKELKELKELQMSFTTF